MVIHCIFDPWHYKVLRTYILTRLLWYAGDFVHWILYIMLNSIYHAAYNKPESKLPDAIHCILPTMLCSILLVALDGTLLACLTVHSRVLLRVAVKYTPEHVCKDTSICIWWLSPRLLDCSLTSNLSRCFQFHSWTCSQVHSQLHSMTHSQPTWLYTPKYTLKRQDTPNLTWLYSPMYAPGCSIMRLVQLHMLGTGRCEAAGVEQALIGRWWVACGVWQVEGAVCWPKSCCQLIMECESYLQHAHREDIACFLTVMVLTIAASDSARMVSNWILERADLPLRFSSGICCMPPINFGYMWVHSVLGQRWWWQWYDGNGDDGDGVVGDGDHSNRST